MSTTTTNTATATNTHADERWALLEELWAFLARHCLDYMRTVPPEERSTRHLAVIRGFLRDSGITAEKGRRLGDTGVLGAMLNLQVPFGGPDGSGH
jgi:hypothetical protein